MWQKFTCSSCDRPLYKREETCPECDDVLPDRGEAHIVIETDDTTLWERIISYLNHYLPS